MMRETHLLHFPKPQLDADGFVVAPQNLMRQQIRKTLTAESRPAEPTPTATPKPQVAEKSAQELLQPEKPEKTIRTFDKVIFGHPLPGFDRDQLIAYYLALKLGTITQETPITFTAEPTQEDLLNPKSLVIESYILPEENKNALRQGNYLTGPQDEPAAAMFFHYFSREFKQVEHYEQLQELVDWLKSVDMGHEPTQPPKLFNPAVLQLITPIFYALKLDTTDRQSLLKKSVELLDVALQNPKDSAPLLEKYHIELAKLQIKRREDFQKLETRAKQPEFLKKATTLTGVKLAYFDVRGLDVESGGLTVAERETDADVIFLIDKIMDPEDQTKVLGTQLIIKATDSASTDQNKDAISALTQRLQTSEMLFGKGFKITRTYGGHPGIISSPAWLGSDLQPENTWMALQKYFNSPRYSQEGFTKKAYQIAEKVGVEKGIPQLFLPPSDEYSLAEWQMQFNIPSQSGSFQIIRLNESDIPLYESCLTNDGEKNKQLLLQKTIVSEPVEITAQRQKKAETAIGTMIVEKQANQLLLLIDDLNKTSIEQLSIDQQLAILEAISQDSISIDQVWNKDNLLFRITSPIPEWIAGDLETYKAQRFRYTSVPTKVESYLIDSIVAKVIPDNESPVLERLVNILVSIITSETYKKSHQEKSYDTLLEKCLQVCLKTELSSATAENMVRKLDTEYGSTMVNHWKEIPEPLLAKIRQKFPESLPFLEISAQPTIEADKRFLTIRKPNVEQLSANPTIHTIFVEIGREIEFSLKEKGINGRDEHGKPQHFTEIPFTSEIRATQTSLLLDDEHAQHITVAKEIATHVAIILEKSPESKIRIIAGSFPNMLTRQVVTRIPRHAWNQVFFCDYNFQFGQFHDDKPLSDTD